MSDTATVQISRGDKHVNEAAHQEVMKAVLDAAQLDGVWRMSFISHANHCGTGKWFLRESDDNGISVLIQPNGSGSGCLWDVLPPVDYDIESLLLELRSFNGWNVNTKRLDDAISVEVVERAGRFRENEENWNLLNARKTALEQQFEALSADLNDVTEQMKLIEASIARDVDGKASWERLKKMLRL